MPEAEPSIVRIPPHTFHDASRVQRRQQALSCGLHRSLGKMHTADANEKMMQARGYRATSRAIGQKRRLRLSAADPFPQGGNAPGHCAQLRLPGHALTSG